MCMKKVAQKIKWWKSLEVIWYTRVENNAGNSCCSERAADVSEMWSSLCRTLLISFKSLIISSSSACLHSGNGGKVVRNVRSGRKTSFICSVSSPDDQIVWICLKVFLLLTHISSHKKASSMSKTIVQSEVRTACRWSHVSQRVTRLSPVQVRSWVSQTIKCKSNPPSSSFPECLTDRGIIPIQTEPDLNDVCGRDVRGFDAEKDWKLRSCRN